MVKNKHVLIIGGGITGLSSAFYLHRKAKKAAIDLKITLVEKERYYGGKIRTYQHLDGNLMEEGPDSFIARKKSALNLCYELGIEDQLVGTNPTTRKTYILNYGELTKMPGGTIIGIPTEIKPFIQTNLLSLNGKIRAGIDLFLPRGNKEQDESLGHFFRRRMGDELVEWFQSSKGKRTNGACG